MLGGEQFLLILYNSQKYSSLDESRLFLYNRDIAKTKLTSTFKLATLPPTSSAARQHLLRVYHQVQQWLGNELDPLKWGWKFEHGKLIPNPTDLPPAPEELLNIITCDCKTSCNTNKCECRRTLFQCSIMCGRCWEICQNRNFQDICDEKDN